MSELTVDLSFPGGKRVNARVGEFVIETDQTVRAGGEASAPEPFSLFLASIATCAGIYALSFCQTRNIDTEGLALRMRCIRDERLKRFSELRLHIGLPAGFPDRYREGIARAVDLCAVKQHIHNPPAFRVVFDD